MKAILTPEQSRAARRALGFTQSQLIEKSKLSGYKLKQFESGFADPEGVTPFLRELRDFYEAEGYQFTDAPHPTSEQPTNQQPFKLPYILSDDGLTQRTVLVCRHFFIDKRLTDEQLQEAGERIEESFNQAKELMGLELGREWLSDDFDEATTTKLRELWGHLARIGLVSLHLQGRILINQDRITANSLLDGDQPKPKTFGELLSDTYGEAVAAFNDADQPELAEDEEVTA